MKGPERTQPSALYHQHQHHLPKPRVLLVTSPPGTNRNWRQTSAPSIRYGLGYTLVSAYSAAGAPAPRLLI